MRRTKTWLLAGAAAGALAAGSAASAATPDEDAARDVRIARLEAAVTALQDKVAQDD